MAAKATRDMFANIASIQCDESAANTLTFKKLETGMSIMDKVAWVISRVEYYINHLEAAYFNTDTDSLFMALTVSNTINTLISGRIEYDPAVLHGIAIQRLDIGAAASGFLEVRPLVFDFSTLPGGGLIAPPNPLYLAVQGVGLATAETVWARLYYTNLELTTDQYWELIESRRIISA